MKRVTGIGGVFYRAKDKKALLAWYREHLGIEAEDWGFVFPWSDSQGYTVWSPLAEDTDYFAPSDKQFMINFRVDDLEALMAALKDEGVQIVGEIEGHENGKFGWIMDPEGNKIELWEPIEESANS